eukprot:Nk52_evm5s280 gene=Nk52_evmTU5s280
MSTETIPQTMKVAILRKKFMGSFEDVESLKEHIAIEQRPVPVPKSGELLVRVENATINPSDLAHLRGMYGIQKEAPYALGFEASGVVVASGGGLTTWGKLGKKVGFYAEDGAWAEYAIVKAVASIVLPDDVTTEEGTACIVNPFTVMSFVDMALNGNHKYILHTAAASALGKMLIRIAANNGIEVICVVRRDEQVELCKQAGAKFIVNTSEADYKQKLTAICEETKCTMAFDAVGGPIVADVLGCMVNDSTLYSYGSMSNSETLSVNIKDLIFKGKKVEGFWVPKYQKSVGLYKLWSWSKIISASIKQDLKSDYQGSFALEELAESLKQYTQNMSKGKVLIKPTQSKQ